MVQQDHKIDAECQSQSSILASQLLEAEPELSQMQKNWESEVTKLKDNLSQQDLATEQATLVCIQMSISLATVLQQNNLLC